MLVMTYCLLHHHHHPPPRPDPQDIVLGRDRSLLGDAALRRALTLPVVMHGDAAVTGQVRGGGCCA
jgi:hypothetical protein